MREHNWVSAKWRWKPGSSSDRRKENSCDKHKINFVCAFWTRDQCTLLHRYATGFNTLCLRWFTSCNVCFLFLNNIWFAIAMLYLSPDKNVLIASWKMFFDMVLSGFYTRSWYRWLDRLFQQQFHECNATCNLSLSVTTHVNKYFILCTHLSF